MSNQDPTEQNVPDTEHWQRAADKIYAKSRSRCDTSDGFVMRSYSQVSQVVVTREEALDEMRKRTEITVSEAEIEAAARAIYTHPCLDCIGDDKSFVYHMASESFKEKLRDVARDIIMAAKRAESKEI